MGLIISIIMGLGLYFRTVHWLDLKRRSLFFFPILSLFLVPLCARLFYFLARFAYLLPTQGWAGIFNFSPEGLSYTGSILGLWLSGYLTAQISGEHYNKMLDAVTPAALLVLLLSRLSEYFVSFGQGKYIEQEFLHFFPLAVKNQWGEWYYAVFMLEAFFALLILFDAIKNRERSHGYRWQKALLFLFCSQILCESFRAETLKWGFVRVYQLFCALGIVWFYIKWSRRGVKRGLAFKSLLPYFGLLLFAVAVLPGIEYALDKWREMPHWVLYTLMVSVLISLADGGMRLLKKSKGMVM